MERTNGFERVCIIAKMVLLSREQMDHAIGGERANFIAKMVLQ
jgi:hypothetical protein